MNVLIIGKDPGIFGAARAPGDARERHLKYLETLRSDAGGQASIRVICWTPRAQGFEDQEAAPGLLLFPTRSRFRALFLLDAALLLKRVLAGWRPDVITAQEPWEEGLLALALARLAGAAFVAQLHTDIWSEGWGRSRLNRIRTALGSRVLRRADRVRVVAASLERRLTDAGMSPPRIAVVPVAVTLGPPPHEAARPPVVLFAGRFSPEKNLPRWLRVAARVARAVPEARFVLAGDGPERKRIEAHLDAAGLRGRFELPGRIEYGELAKVYAGASVLLLTSEYEGMPRTAVEAMLCGLAVVSTACPGVADAVEDGATGYLLPHADEEGLALRVVELLRSPETARRMGEEGRRKARRDFSADAVAREWTRCWIQTRLEHHTCDCCCST